MHNLDKPVRLVEFDVIKWFAIFLVLWGHSILHLSSGERYDNVMYQFISSFHMPLFMLVSGFFAFNSMNLSFRDLVSKKIWRLIYPCFSFGVLFCIIILLWDSLLGEKSGQIHIMPYLYEVFWFLKSTFLCYVITYLCIKLFNNRFLLGCVLAALIAQIIPLFKINWMLPFFVTGIILNGKYDLVRRHIKIVFVLSVVCFIALFEYVNIGDVNKAIVGVKTGLINGNMSALSVLFEIQLLRYLIGLAGSMMVISLIVMLSPKIGNKLLTVISKYGRETLGIYIMQTLLLETLCSRLIDLHMVNLWLFTYLICPIVSLLIMYICVQIVDAIHKCKHLDTILFGKT